MDDQVAQALIEQHLRRLRTLSYGELIARIGRYEITEIVAHDGKKYQLETQVCWDGREGGDVRVMVAADDGGWRVFVPLTDDFIMRPDGTFADESFDGTGE